MKKKAILGFMTGAAIVAATTGSYAAWDKLSDTSTTTLNIGKPITISPTTGLAFDETAVNDTNSKLYEATNPSYEASVTFTPVIPANRSADNLEIELETTVGGLTKDTDYTVTYEEDGKALDNNIDKTVSSGAQTYSVKIELKDSAVTKIPDSDVNVSVTATLKEQASTN